ncbi:MAG: DUF3822 family protein, partial [Chitinophagales bacterium]
PCLKKAGFSFLFIYTFEYLVTLIGRMVHYIHSEFNTAFTRHLTLLLEIDLYAFTYCLYNSTDGNIAVIKKVDFNMQRQDTFHFEKFQAAIHTEDLLHCPFAAQFISIAGGPFTLIPAPLFQSNLMDKYLDLTYTSGFDAAEHSVFIAPIEAVNVYRIPHKLSYFIAKVFKNANLHHICNALIKRAHAYAENNEGTNLFAEIRSGYFYIMLFKNRELLLLNKFDYTNKEDFLYFILLVCDQFKIDRTTDTLILSGDILEGSVLYNELYKFFMQIRFMPADNFFYLPEALELPVHTINGLLSLHLCASYQEI